MEQLDRIYIQKDTTLIQELTEALPECENDEIKSLIALTICWLSTKLPCPLPRRIQPSWARIFRALFAEALPEQQFPEELVRTGAGSSYVKKISVSKTATTK